MDWFTVTQGGMTILIAIITAYMAYQQWKTNQNKLKHDLFERRMELYNTFEQFLIEIIRDANIERSGIKRLANIEPKISFSFNEEITEFHQKLISKGSRLRLVH